MCDRSAIWRLVTRLLGLGLIGKSRCHLTNALEGRFPLGHEAAERLASWLRNPEPPLFDMVA